MKKILSLLIILLLFVLGSKLIAQTAAQKLPKHQSKRWYKKKEWLGGLQLQPHKTINKQEFARQYYANKVFWDKAFAFLKEQDLQTLANEKHVIDGDNVYAFVTHNPTKDYDSTNWESHQNYIDLQYVISGEEKIGIYPVKNLTVTKPYDAVKDLINYSGEGKIYDASPQGFFIFFPFDGHRPNITPGGNKADKKIVIKIKYAK